MRDAVVVAVEIIVRGVCVKRGTILLCRSRGAANTYLPGGHIEFGESARNALRREIREELGVESRVGRLLGAVENRFLQKGRRHCEVNLVFGVSIRALSPDRAPASREKGVEFRWCGCRSADLAAERLEPAVLCGCLPPVLTGRRGATFWASGGEFAL
jgi:ADP-ribose pyrophosphatase YjhB (NUDIX family)